MVTWPLSKCRPPQTQFFVSLWVRHSSSVFIDTNYIFFLKEQVSASSSAEVKCILFPRCWQMNRTFLHKRGKLRKKKKKKQKLHLWSFTGNIEFWKQKYLTTLITCTSTRWEMWVEICTAIFPVLLLVQLEKSALLAAVTIRYQINVKKTA